MAASRKEPSLTQLIRRSPALDAAARRRWLAVLPHLTAEDRERLRAILVGDLAAANDLTIQSPIYVEAGEQGGG